MKKQCLLPQQLPKLTFISVIFDPMEVQDEQSKVMCS